MKRINISENTAYAYIIGRSVSLLLKDTKDEVLLCPVTPVLVIATESIIYVIKLCKHRRCS
jgi:hypothetical protein